MGRDSVILAPISRMVFGFPDGFLMTSIHPWRILYGSLPLATRLARAGEVRQGLLPGRPLPFFGLFGRSLLVLIVLR